MTSVAVLLPVLGRPERVEPLLASLYASRRVVDVTAFFLATGDDEAELAALEESGESFAIVEPTRQPGSYARKINTGAQWARDDAYDWVFLGADDLCFCPGWADEAVRVGEEAGKAVVGTDDDANPFVKRGRHATHPLVRTDYLDRGTVDESGKLLHEGYDHQCCDVEFCQTAMMRDEWVFAKDAMVEHLHFLFKDVARDATYELGQACGREDIALMQSRQRLWQR